MVGGGGGIASGIATSTYKHNVDNCACGTCHKSRVDSGTDDAYYERCIQASRAIENKLSSTHNAETCACGTCHNARVAAGTQGAYIEWNRKALEASLEKAATKSARRGLNPLK